MLCVRSRAVGAIPIWLLVCLPSEVYNLDHAGHGPDCWTLRLSEQILFFLTRKDTHDLNSDGLQPV